VLFALSFLPEKGQKRIPLQLLTQYVLGFLYFIKNKNQS